MFSFVKKKLSNFRAALKKTKQAFTLPILKLLGRDLNENTKEELEEALYEADFGIELVDEVITGLETQLNRESLETVKERADCLKKLLFELTHLEEPLIKDLEEAIYEGEPLKQGEPLVLMIVGINGTGKTTTIAKLSKYYQDLGKKVLVGAADTFRAAAVDQLNHWAQDLGVDIVRGKQGADPSSVIYDTLEAAKARGADLVLIDTAGRLHNKSALMDELSKMTRVCDKAIKGAPHATFLIVDAICGQNGLEQAQVFSQIGDLTGMILTKLDGAAKGGIALSIQKKMKKPICFIGTGEGSADFAPFDLKTYLDELFEGSVEDSK